MIFGAITNSWRLQLEQGDLLPLVQEAQSRNSKHIELRQTCLGSCETGKDHEWRPVLPNLQSLVEKFPDLSFDLAMALPCLSQRVDPMGEQFQAALEGAKIVGRNLAHLRLVDPTAAGPVWESADDIPEEAMGLADLAREAARQGVVISVENSGQPIRSMALLVNRARSEMSDREGAFLGLCPDPTNQLRRFPGSDPLAELEALPVDMIKIIHFKQAGNGAPHPAVDDGDLNCQRMIRLLEAKGYQGAGIMEIPPHKDVFENLSASFSYLGGLAGTQPE
jgi:hypothetical protein